MGQFLNETIIGGWIAVQQASYALPTVAALLGAFVLYTTVVASNKVADAHQLDGLSILTAWPFFTRRYDFLKYNLAKTRQNMFSFKVLHHSVVAVKGEAARKAFFDNGSLDMAEGYRILMGGVPKMKDIDVPVYPGEGDLSWLSKQLITLLRKDRIADVLPTLFDDIQARTEGWGREGRMDPFKDIYDVVFQMTVRMASCQELATDMAAVAKLQQDYWMLEKSATPVALLLPWFPSTAKKNKETATRSLFTTLCGYVEMRKKADVPTSDAIDLMLAKGLTTEETIGCMLSIFFAGVVQTGIGACWTLLYLSFHKEWKQNALQEVNALIQTHTNATSSEPLYKRLSAIPVSAWEEGMPTLDIVLRETLRLTVNTTALRRNVHEDLYITGKRLPKGHFIAYPFGDVHMNSDIYTNPTEFDPTRFGPGREEDKKQTYGYLGWGAGRHSCTGMKFAKLEIKILVSLFLAGYEFDVVNSEGKFPEHLPKPNYNDIHQTRPLGDPCYIQFKRVVE